MTPPDRRSLLGIIGGLMAAENLGDVHDEINLLRALVDLPPLEGSFEEGWTDEDWRSVGKDEGIVGPDDG